MSFKNVTVALAMAMSTSTLFAASVRADELVVSAFGGVSGEAQEAAYFKPFAEKTGIRVITDTYNGELAALRAQVLSGSPKWDIVQPEDGEVVAACEEGLLEPLDTTRLPMADLLPGTVLECGVASLTSATALAYDAAKYPQAPQSWADFFDLEKFPGKRGLRRKPTYTLEVALLADGVPLQDVYKVLATKEGQDRAFRKLDTIKSEIVWWSTGTQQQQGFVSGEFDIGLGYNARIATIAGGGDKDVRIAWNAGYILSNNYWVILKGAKNKSAAMDFIVAAMAPEAQAIYMKRYPYSGANSKALELLTEAELSFLPANPKYVEYAVRYDSAVWRDNLDLLTERFERWISQ